MYNGKKNYSMVSGHGGSLSRAGILMLNAGYSIGDKYWEIEDQMDSGLIEVNTS